MPAPGKYFLITYLLQCRHIQRFERRYYRYVFGERESTIYITTSPINSGCHNRDIDGWFGFSCRQFFVAPAFALWRIKKILGADYGFLISPSLGIWILKSTHRYRSWTVSVGGVSKPFLPNIGKIEDDATDRRFFCRPLWLVGRKHYDTSFTYGFYLPTGYYDKDHIANIGYGFFTIAYRQIIILPDGE